MVKLINGRGQLGRELSKAKKPGYDCIIYHTWNIDDHSEIMQAREYGKFVDFVNHNLDENIYFISTKQGQQGYLHYKLKAELYLLEVTETGRIIRIPKLIGKGICADFRNGKIFPFDEIEEIMTPGDAAIEIMNMLSSNKRMNIVTGTLLNKKIIYELIRFGVGK